MGQKIFLLRLCLLFQGNIPSHCLVNPHKRGIKILPGGDYGFAWVPHGTNAKDLEYFVKYIGMSTMDALLSATKEGGKIMMRPHELGQIKDGYLADLILVDGDPLADITVLQGLVFAGFAQLAVPEDCTALIAWNARLQDRPSVKAPA